jgi:microcystin degradation protein MlrC
MRFIICGIGHETHTFSSIPADRDLFEKFDLSIGEEIIQKYRGTMTEVGGYLDYCEQTEIDVIPTLTAFAMPSGKVTTAALEEFLAAILKMIQDAEPVDGVLVRLHGAMVSEDQDDAEGYILKQIREVVGENVPVIATFDLHANLTRAMAKYADILVGYDTYPHIDLYERGFEAAELAHKIAIGRSIPTMALKKLPYWPVTQKQVTSRPPMSEIYTKAFELEAMDEVLVVSVATGFPWADIKEMGFGVAVTTDNDEPLAEHLAAEFAEFFWERREDFLYEPTPVDEAVIKAINAPEGPIVLADISDNPGGGTPCDGTVLLKSLLDHHALNAAVAIITDPEAVSTAIESGIGTEVTLQIGGKIDNLHGPTLTLIGKVKSISDGEFVLKGPMMTGVGVQLGKTVVFHVKGIDIILTENRYQPLDLEFFRSNGITPEDKKILVTKSSAHFRADFEPIAKEIIEVGTPGLLSSNLSLFDFKKIPRPFWPLDQDQF